MDRSTFKYLPEALRQSLASNQEVQEWWTDPEGFVHVLRPFKHYADFVVKIANSDQTAAAYLRLFDHTDSGKRIAILGLNSALLSGRHKVGSGRGREVNDDRYLVLGESQIHDYLYDESFRGADIRIAVMHHPFEWLIEFDRELVRDRLRKACHFILHGHEHLPRVNVEIGPGRDCVTIPAGPSYYRREPEVSRCANSYNFVHLDFMAGRGTVYLRRYEDRQGWLKDTGTTGDESPGHFEFALADELKGATGNTRMRSAPNHTPVTQQGVTLPTTPGGSKPAALPMTTVLQVNQQQKRELVSALVACAAMANLSTRDAIIYDLPDDIKNSIQHSNVARVHVNNIVTRCLSFVGGIEAFIEIVRDYEGDSQEMQAIDAIVQRIKAE